MSAIFGVALLQQQHGAARREVALGAAPRRGRKAPHQDGKDAGRERRAQQAGALGQGCQEISTRPGGAAFDLPTPGARDMAIMLVYFACDTTGPSWDEP
jgi:hypothetical protein